MKYVIISSILSLVINVSFAQTMYLDSVFTDVVKTTHTFHSYEEEALQFDYYIAGDLEMKRPLLLYVHGGGFSGGQRDSRDIVDFANDLAQRGYAVASVSYRLTMKGIGFGCDVEADQKVEAINAASFDASLALKYLLDHPDEFSIDPTKVILAGGSAGAEAVLNLAYVYDDHALPTDYKFGGVIGFAGAIPTLEKINQEKAIPTQLFHGTGDRLVPYGIAPHHYCESTKPGYLMLYGSEPIAARLKGLGVSYYLYTITGGSHSWADLPKEKCMYEIIDFLYNDVVEVRAIRQTERTIVE